MKPVMLGLVCLSALAVATPADAWVHSGAWGGHASGTAGSWSATGARGGTASGGGGSWSGTGYRGGTASGGSGSWSATGYRGGTAAGGEGSWHGTGAYGTTYAGGYYGGYHPPTVVNHYYGTGCWNCGGWNTCAAVAAGAVAGVAVGAAAASANTAAATSNAYAAGVAAGSAPVIYAALPAGCVYSPVGGQAYYRCGAAWFSPYYGANGTYYRVVPGPG
jgi:hypothetical protein